MKPLLLILFASLLLTIECRALRCSYMCDDPVCPARCIPICKPAKCQLYLSDPENQAITSIAVPGNPKQDCNVRCENTTITTVDHYVCPRCETVCKPPVGCPTGRECNILCEMANCYWHCEKPAAGTCPKPRCELQCERSGCTQEDNLSIDRLIQQQQQQQQQRPTIKPTLHLFDEIVLNDQEKTFVNDNFIISSSSVAVSLFISTESLIGILTIILLT